MRNVKAACVHSINLPQLHIYNIFNTGSFLPPWNPGAFPRALCNGSGQVHLSVFQGGAESLREPLCPCPYHLNPSLGFGCASLGLALADLLLNVSQAPGGMKLSASRGAALSWAATSAVSLPQPTLRGGEIFKFSENPPVLSLALCLLNRLLARGSSLLRTWRTLSPWSLAAGF